MPSKEDVVDKENRTTWISNNIGVSYTQAFDIRKVMYRIQNMDLPFKRGIRVEQFLMFFFALMLAFIVYYILISPILSLLGISLPFTFLLVYFLAPPILLSIRIGKPMPHGKTIFGTVISWLRFKLDDQWHRRGMPMKKEPNLKAQGNYLRTWTVDPRYAGLEEPNDLPATEFLQYSRIELPDSRQVILTPDQLKAEEERIAGRRILEGDSDFYKRLYGDGIMGGIHDDELDTKDLASEDDYRVDDEYIERILAGKK